MDYQTLATEEQAKALEDHADARRAALEREHFQITRINLPELEEAAARTIAQIDEQAEAQKAEVQKQIDANKQRVADIEAQLKDTRGPVPVSE